MFLPFFQAGYLAAGAKLHITGLAKRAAATKAALAAEREKAKEAIQDHEIAQTIAIDKEKELAWAIWVKLDVQETAAMVQAELEIARADLVAT